MRAGFTDYLHYVLEDPEVRLVLGYLEDARDGEAFQAAARRALALDKPLIIMKQGVRSRRQGQRFAYRIARGRG